MPIPTELVGSLPRPEKLQNAYQDLDDGKIALEDLQALQDEAAEDSIKRLEATGEPIVTDGEQRESSFATYPITDTLAGTGLADNLAGDGQFFAIFDDGHHRQLPRLTGGPFRYKTYASEFVEKNRRSRRTPVKQAVIAPSMLMLLYPLEGEIEGYSREQFLADLCDEVEKDIRQCFDGRRRPRLGRLHRGAPGQQERRAQPLDRPGHARRTSSTSTTASSTASAPRSGATSASTPAPAATSDSVHCKDVPYEKLLSKMFQINAGYFLIQCASEEDKEEVYRLCGQYSRDDADGVAAGVLHGRHQPADARGRDRRAGPNDLVTAAKHIPVERLGATDDCGFSPFSRDLKPKHGSPDFARDVAMQKITARLEGTRHGVRAARRLARLIPPGRRTPAPGPTCLDPGVPGGGGPSMIDTDRYLRFERVGAVEETERGVLPTLARRAAARRRRRPGRRAAEDQPRRRASTRPRRSRSASTRWPARRVHRRARRRRRARAHRPRSSSRSGSTRSGSTSTAPTAARSIETAGDADGPPWAYATLNDAFTVRRRCRPRGRDLRPGGEDRPRTTAGGATSRCGTPTCSTRTRRPSSPPAGRRATRAATAPSTEFDPYYVSIPFFYHHDARQTGAMAGRSSTTATARAYDVLGGRRSTASTSRAGSTPSTSSPGPGMPDVVRAYTALTGRTAPPPLWALGYHQCRWFRYTQDAVEALARAPPRRADPVRRAVARHRAHGRLPRVHVGRGVVPGRAGRCSRGSPSRASASSRSSTRA